MSSKHVRKDSSCLCVVCCEEVEFYAIGKCDHPVCYKCCVRMRVLTKENYCSVCRTELNTAFLTANCAKWESLKSKALKSDCDKKYGLCYASREIRDKVKELLQHKCTRCTDHKLFHTFEKLEDHMRRTHQLYYCNLCVKHYTKFSHERNIYTRQDLARHRRVGDANDKSHKGHPLCEFCDERFLDNDELHRHLRKAHFWCHFCERDGKQLYYDDYPNLRGHFRDAHLLCEEDDCQFEQFTSVFRTEIDLQAHRAAKHAKNFTKSQARQARQVEIDITFNREPAQGRTITGRDYNEVQSNERRFRRDGKARSRGQATGNSSNKEEQDIQTAVQSSLKTAARKQSPSPPKTPDEPPPLPPARPVQESVGHYPALLSARGPPKAIKPAEKSISKADPYPALPSSKGPLKNTKGNQPSPKPNKKQDKSKTSKPNKDSARGVHSEDDFPSLGGTSGAKPPTGPPPGFVSAAKRVPLGLDASQGAIARKPPPGFTPTNVDTKKQQTSANVLNDCKPYGVPQRQTSAPCGTRKENIVMSSQNSAIAGNTKPAESLNRQERNQALIESIRSLLGHDKGKFKEFKTLSGTFRQGLCTGEEYYAECMRLFDENFTEVFGELVDLLPDDNKRVELLKVSKEARCAKAWESQPEKQVKQVSKPVSTSRPTPAASHEVDFPSLPAASKPVHHVHRSLYRSNNTALKSAWVRGK